MASAEDGCNLSTELRIAGGAWGCWFHGWALLGQVDCLQRRRGWETLGWIPGGASWILEF